MAYINLLPWREKLRQHNNKYFLKLVYMMMALGIAIILFLWIVFKMMQNHQLQKNQKLEQGNLQLMTQIQQDEATQNELQEIMSQIKLYTQTVNNRKVQVEVWSLIANTLPQTIELTSIHKSQQSITFKGVAANATAVSHWVRRLEDSQYLQYVQIVTIKQQSSKQQSSKQQSSKQQSSKQQSSKQLATYEAPHLSQTLQYEFIVTAEVLDISSLQNQYQTLNQLMFFKPSFSDSIQQSSVEKSFVEQLSEKLYLPPIPIFKTVHTSTPPLYVVSEGRSYVAKSIVSKTAQQSLPINTMTQFNQLNAIKIKKVKSRSFTKLPQLTKFSGHTDV